LSSGAAKNIHLRKTEIMYHFAPSRLGKRGVRVVTNVGRDAMDASGID
jgi:hypothetical protein